MYALNSHKTAGASDIDTAVQKFVGLNFKPTKMFGDVRNRSKDELPTEPIGLYVAGFPCKAFSYLTTTTSLLEDKRARPFFSTVRTIRWLRPKACVLENVHGFMRCWSAAKRLLKQITNPGYIIVMVTLCPTKLGALCQRKRVYILLIREDVAAEDVSDDDAARTKCKALFEALSSEAEASLSFEDILSQMQVNVEEGGDQDELLLKGSSGVLLSGLESWLETCAPLACFLGYK